MEYVVKFSEIGIRLLFIFLAFKGNNLYSTFAKNILSGSLFIIAMIVVIVYTHFYANIPAEVSPMEFKPPENTK